MQRIINHLLIITFFSIFSIFLIWLPHLLAIPNFWGLNFQNGFNTIYRNFDGPEYIIIAKSFYQPELIAQIPQPQESSYYASHFPGYPLLIALFGQIMGFLKSMLFVSLVFTIFSAIAFYFLVKDFRLTSNPLFLSLIFLILPARWVIVRSVGSPEPMFIFFIILSVYFFLKATNSLNFFHILISTSLVAMAQLTRPPGALLGLALGIFVFWQAYQKRSIIYLLKFWPFVLVPLTLFGIFAWFANTYQDFWAYFHSGDNIHLIFPPFSIFNTTQYWVGTIWLEDVIYIYILGLLAGILLIKQRLYPMAFFILTYLLAAMFVAHRDISRYTIPLVPFALIAFEKVLVSREFRWVIIPLILAIYLYSQNFILQNVAPIPDLSVYD